MGSLYGSCIVSIAEISGMFVMFTMCMQRGTVTFVVVVVVVVFAIIIIIYYLLVSL